MGAPLHKRIERFSDRYMPAVSAVNSAFRTYKARQDMLRAAYKSKSRSVQRGLTVSDTKRSEDFHLEADLPDMIENSRDTWRNNSIYSGVIGRAVDRIIGTGIWPVPATTDKDTNQALQQEFREYALSPDFSIHGLTLPECERLICETCMREGNTLAYRPDDGWQFFEGAQIGTPIGYDATKTIKAGVEVVNSRPFRYWVSEYARWGYLDPASAVGIRADKCALLGNRKYFSGHRAIPPLANAISRFEDLDGYLEAELFGARMSSSVLGEVKSANENVWNALKSRLQKSSSGSVDNVEDLKWRPASVFRTLPGEEFKLHYVQRPGNAFPPFVRVLFRLLGLPLGMPLEIAFLDYSETNFSAAKALTNEAKRSHEVWQQLVIAYPFVGWVYRDWYENIRTTKIKRSVKKEASFEYDYPTFPWIDELKAAQARLVGVKGGWESLTRISREMNRDVEDVIGERVREMKVAYDACEQADMLDWFPLVISQVGKLDEILKSLGIDHESNAESGDE